MSTLPTAFTRTGSDVAAEVLMTRSAFAGAVLLVEGSPDSRFIHRHVDKSAIQIVMCGGKQTAVAAIAELSKYPITGYLAILDKDYDHHKGVVPASVIFYTDTHDLETLLLSRRLETLLGEVAEADKVRAFEQSEGCSVREALLRRGEAFSKLRFLNEVKPAFGVGMDSFTPWKYVDIVSWTVDETALHSDFAGACGHAFTTLAALLASLPALDSWKNVHGHDVLAILSIGLRQRLASGKQVGEKQLCSSLRLAFSEQDFKSTGLYTELKKWEQATGFAFLL